MKRKLDSKVTKMESELLGEKNGEEQTDSHGHKIRHISGTSVQDMDLGEYTILVFLSYLVYLVYCNVL